jgi:predicted AAA+ superfamily ATPase
MTKKQSSPFESNPLFGPWPVELTEDLYSLNPWWRGHPGISIPSFRRWPFKRLWHCLHQGMAPATLLRGPRRVGKTVLLRQILQQLLDDGVEPNRILYLAFDEIPSLKGFHDPVLSVARWFEQTILQRTFNAAAQAGKPAYLLLDEVQNLTSWAEQLKHLVDNHTVRVIVTGSSSLRIEAGRDSLAGRVTTVEMGPLLLREIAGLRYAASVSPRWGDNGLDPLASADFWRDLVNASRPETELRLRAFLDFSQRGGYPDAHQEDRPWSQIAEHLNETVIRRAIQHDLRMGPRGQKRDEKLLEEVFRLCCRYAGQTAGQSVFVPEIRDALAGNIGWNRILTYMKFLDGTLLIRLVQPIELRLKRKKSPAKICLSDHSLRASWLQEIVPLDREGLDANPHLSDLAGRLAESILGYFLASVPTLGLSHFPERSTEPEVDFVMTVGTRRIPIEVKYRRRIDPFEDTRGLRSFLEKTVYNAPFALLVTLEDEVKVPDPRIIPISLSSFLWSR